MFRRMSSLPAVTPLTLGKYVADKGEKIANGTFGTVYSVSYRQAEGLYAVGEGAVLKEIFCRSSGDKDGALEELKALLCLDHKYIAKIYEVAFRDGPFVEEVRSSPHLFVLVEFCNGGTFGERLLEPSSDLQNLRWMSQISEGLAFLHSKNLVHGDLKPDNILLNKVGTSEDMVSLKLTDYGLAKSCILFSQEQAEGESENKMIKFYKESPMDVKSWTAPEVFNNAEHKKTSDIFSMGCVFYGLLERHYKVTADNRKLFGAFVYLDHPKVGDAPLGWAFHMAPQGLVPEIGFSRTTSLANSLKDLTRQMLAHSLNRRPSAEKVLDELKLFASGFDKPNVFKAFYL